MVTTETIHARSYGYRSIRYTIGTTIIPLYVTACPQQETREPTEVAIIVLIIARTVYR